MQVVRHQVDIVEILRVVARISTLRYHILVDACRNGEQFVLHVVGIESFAQFFQQRYIVDGVFRSARTSFVGSVVRIGGAVHARIFPVDIDAVDERVLLQKSNDAVNENGASLLGECHGVEIVSFGPSAHRYQKLNSRIELFEVLVFGKMPAQSSVFPAFGVFESFVEVNEFVGTLKRVVVCHLEKRMIDMCDFLPRYHTYRNA